MKKQRRFLCLFLCAALCAGLLAACGGAKTPAAPAASEALPPEPVDAEAVVDMEHTLGLAAVQADGPLGLLLRDIVYSKHALGGGQLWVWGVSRETEQTAIASVPMDGAEGQVLTLHFPALDEELRALTPEDEALGGNSISIRYEMLSSDGAYPYLVRSRNCAVDSEEEHRFLYAQQWLCTVDAQGNVSEGVPIDFNRGDAESRSNGLDGNVVGSGVLWAYLSGLDEEIGVFRSEELLAFDAATGAMLGREALPPHFVLSDIQPLDAASALVLGFDQKPEDGNLMNLDGQCILVARRTEQGIELEQTVEIPAELKSFDRMQIADSPAPGPVYLLGGRGICRWEPEDNTWTLLHSREDIGIPGIPPSGIYLVEDSFYLTVGFMSVVNNTSTKQTFEVWLLGEEAAVPPDERPVVTVGVLAENKAALHGAVNAFNKASPDLRAEMVVYTQAAAEAAGLDSPDELLHRDILQGTAPDVITGLYGADLRQLIGKGAILDLFPLLDADEDYSRGDFAAGPLTAGTVDGGLYGVIPSYILLTTVGSAEKLGDTMGWSREEFEALTAGIPTPYYGFGRDTLLWHQFQAYGAQFIDYAAGEAHLDTPEFVALLERFAACPETMGYYNTTDLKETFATGQAAVGVCFISGFDLVTHDVYTFNGPVTYKGFAGASGSGSILSPSLQLSVCAATPNTDAAWRFVRFFLSREYQFELAGALPLRRDALAAKAAEAQQPYVDFNTMDGILYCIPSYLDQSTTNQNMIDYWTRGLTQEETDKILALAEATSQPFLYDGVVQGILAEEASAYFSGARSAQDAAAILQNRIQTYLDEQS